MTTTATPSPYDQPPDAAAPEPEDWEPGPAAWGARPLRSRRVAPWDLFLLEVVVAVVLVAVAVTTLQRPQAALLALAAALAALGLHAARRARRGGRRIDEGFERRVLTRDVYGLRGRFVAGEVVDELTRGTRFLIGGNPAGEVCLYAYGREYPLSPGELRRVREASTRTERRAPALARDV